MQKSSLPIQEEPTLDVLTHDFAQENTAALKRDIRRLREEKQQIQEVREKIRNTQELDKNFKKDYLPEALLTIADKPAEEIESKYKEATLELKNRRQKTYGRVGKFFKNLGIFSAFSAAASFGFKKADKEHDKHQEIAKKYVLPPNAAQDGLLTPDELATRENTTANYLADSSDIQTPEEIEIGYNKLDSQIHDEI